MIRITIILITVYIFAVYSASEITQNLISHVDNIILESQGIKTGYELGNIHPIQGWVITCQEDMNCWDCETMGNKICENIK